MFEYNDGRGVVVAFQKWFGILRGNETIVPEPGFNEVPKMYSIARWLRDHWQDGDKAFVAVDPLVPNGRKSRHGFAVVLGTFPFDDASLPKVQEIIRDTYAALLKVREFLESKSIDGGANPFPLISCPRWNAETRRLEIPDVFGERAAKKEAPVSAKAKAA